MLINVDKIKEICEKHGFYPKMDNKEEFTYPGMKSGDYAVVIPFYRNDFVICAVDVMNRQDDYQLGFSDSILGFYNTERIYSYKELEKRLIFLKNRIIELKQKIKFENIEKDF